jgi:hypothetical protein
MYGGQESFIEGCGGETRGKGPLERLGCRWQDNIKMDFQVRHPCCVLIAKL